MRPLDEARAAKRGAQADYRAKTGICPGEYDRKLPLSGQRCKLCGKAGETCVDTREAALLALQAEAQRRPSEMPPPHERMTRAKLEGLKAELATRYAERLEHEQTHLTEDQRAHMCIGFEHGLGWFLKLMQGAGFEVEEDAEPELRVCMSCRLMVPANAVRCPLCKVEAPAP